MKITLDVTSFRKCFRFFGVQVDSDIFCLTILWYYKERYDSGIGLFRLQIGKFIEYGEKVGLKIEALGLSWKHLKKTTVLMGVG